MDGRATRLSPSNRSERVRARPRTDHYLSPFFADRTQRGDMRRHLSYANVTATLALVFAMSGGALAAKHYLVTKTNQISPKVLKSFTSTNTSLFKKLSKTVVVTK